MSELPYFSSKAFLAPMAGVSDPALRLMCKKMGAGLVVTELTSVNAIVAKQKKLQSQMKDITEFIEFSQDERPLSIELFGSDIVALEKSAKIVEPLLLAVIVPELVIVMPVVLVLAGLLILSVFLLDEIVCSVVRSTLGISSFKNFFKSLDSCVFSIFVICLYNNIIFI